MNTMNGVKGNTMNTMNGVETTLYYSFTTPLPHLLPLPLSFVPTLSILVVVWSCGCVVVAVVQQAVVRRSTPDSGQHPNSSGTR